MDKKKLLELRRRTKSKKPTFGRKDSNKKKRIESDVWRKARGCDNKQRLKRKGHKKTPKQGYRSPIEVRGLDASGLAPVLVSSLSQLSTITKEQGIILSSGLGGRKRKLILEEAGKKGIRVLNLDLAKAIEQIDAKLKERQEARKSEEEKKKEAEKKASKKESRQDKAAEKKDEPEMSDEDRKKQEKEEKDRLLTHK